MATADGVRALHHQDVTPGHTYRHRRRGRPPGPSGVTVQLPRVLVILQDDVGTDAEQVVQVDDLVPQVDASTTVPFGLGVFALGGGEELLSCVGDRSCGAYWASSGRLAVRGRL